MAIRPFFRGNIGLPQICVIFTNRKEQLTYGCETPLFTENSGLADGGMFMNEVHFHIRHVAQYFLPKVEELLVMSGVNFLIFALSHYHNG